MRITFTEISASAYKGNFKVMLVDVILLVGHCENLALIDIIYFKSL